MDPGGSARLGTAGETLRLPVLGSHPVVRQQTALGCYQTQMLLVSGAGGHRFCYRPWASRPQPDPNLAWCLLSDSKVSMLGQGDMSQAHCTVLPNRRPCHVLPLRKWTVLASSCPTPLCCS